MAVVPLDRAQPPVHGDEAVELAVLVGDQRGRPLPDHLIGVGPELAVESRAHGKRAVGVVEDPRVGTAAVDDRRLAEVVGLVDHPAAIGASQGRRPTAVDARRRRIGVDVEAADLGVQIDELSRGDLT